MTDKCKFLCPLANYTYTPNLSFYGRNLCTNYQKKKIVLGCNKKRLYLTYVFGNYLNPFNPDSVSKIV